MIPGHKQELEESLWPEGLPSPLPFSSHPFSPGTPLSQRVPLPQVESRTQTCPEDQRPGSALSLPRGPVPQSAVASGAPPSFPSHSNTSYRASLKREHSLSLGGYLALSARQVPSPARAVTALLPVPGHGHWIPESNRIGDPLARHCVSLSGWLNLPEPHCSWCETAKTQGCCEM